MNRNKLLSLLCLPLVLAGPSIQAQASAPQTIFEGTASALGKDAMITDQFTQHAGGEWNASVLGEGACFQIEYTGDASGCDLVLISHSGSNRWGRMAPDSVMEHGSSYTAVFSYQNILHSYGDDFGRLDELRTLCRSESGVSVLSIRCDPGFPPKKAPESHWLVPDSGIAFLGDSIVQNAYYFEGDWNTVLGRTDCVNYGIGSQTTVECLGRINELAEKHYRTLVILCGINDLGRGRDAEFISGNIAAMMDRMREKNPGIRFVIMSVLPTTDAFFANRQYRIISLNTALMNLCEKFPDAVYADCHSAFAADNGYCDPSLTLDGLHPNSDGYRLIAKILNPVLDWLDNPVFRQEDRTADPS